MKNASPKHKNFGSIKVVLCSALLSLALPTFAQDKNAVAPEPPYLNSGVSLISVGVVWDEALLRKMLPAGLKPVKEFTGGYNIYKSSRGYGIAPFDATYAWADVEGFDSADGTKGRWMLAGAYGPHEKVTTAAREVFGFPVRNGTNVLEETTQGRRITGLVGGTPVVVAEVKSSPLPCAPVAGTLTYPVQIKGKILVNHIPYSGDWCGASPVALNVVAPAGDVFSTLVPAKILWAGELRNASAAFTRPVSPP